MLLGSQRVLRPDCVWDTVAKDWAHPFITVNPERHEVIAEGIFLSWWLLNLCLKEEGALAGAAQLVARPPAHPNVAGWSPVGGAQ